MSTEATSDIDPHAREFAREASQAETPPEPPGYRLQKKIGQGTFGQVWSGVQESTGQQVAVKFLTAASPSARQSIRREVLRLASLSAYPGVVAILDADLQHEPPYLVSPLMSDSLGNLIRRARQDDQAQPPVHHITLWFEELLSVLEHIHQLGFLHCDIKPDNLLLDNAGKAAVADFGQALGLEEGSLSLGTLFYMCPQQAELDSAGNHLHQAEPGWDLYALAASIYCLLTGRPPRWSEAAQAQLTEIQQPAERLRAYLNHLRQNELVPVRRLNAGVDGTLAAALERCLQLQPEQRPASALEVLSRLRQGQRRGLKMVMSSVFLMLLAYTFVLLVVSKTPFQRPDLSPALPFCLRAGSTGHSLSLILGMAVVSGLAGAWLSRLPQPPASPPRPWWRKTWVQAVLFLILMTASLDSLAQIPLNAESPTPPSPAISEAPALRQLKDECTRLNLPDQGQLANSEGLPVPDLAHHLAAAQRLSSPWSDQDLNCLVVATYAVARWRERAQDESGQLAPFLATLPVLLQQHGHQAALLQRECLHQAREQLPQATPALAPLVESLRQATREMGEPLQECEWTRQRLRAQIAQQLAGQPRQRAQLLAELDLLLWSPLQTAIANHDPVTFLRGCFENSTLVGREPALTRACAELLETWFATEQRNAQARLLVVLLDWRLHPSTPPKLERPELHGEFQPEWARVWANGVNGRDDRGSKAPYLDHGFFPLDVRETLRHLQLQEDEVYRVQYP